MNMHYILNTLKYGVICKIKIVLFSSIVVNSGDKLMVRLPSVANFSDIIDTQT